MSARVSEHLSEWYLEHSQGIITFIFMMTHDYQKAEDLMQETFLKAYKNYNSFQWNASPKTWLFTIARNVTMDFIRRRKPIFYVKELFLSVDQKPLPEEILQMKEEVKQLHSVLYKLKPAYREVIILRKIKDFSIKETTEILGWSESKVKSTLSRGLLAFEELLKKEGYWDEKRLY